MPEDIVAAVQEKQHQDEQQVAELIDRGTPTVPVRTGSDGGMNPVFLAAVQSRGGTANGPIKTASLPGTIPANISLPRESEADVATGSAMSLASAESKPAPAPRGAAAASSSASTSNGLLGNLFASNTESPKKKTEAEPGVLDRMSRLLGLGSSDPKPTTVEAPKAKPVAPKPAQAAARIKPASEAPKSQEANATPQQSGLLSGAQPTVPTGSFDSRWGGFQ